MRDLQADTTMLVSRATGAAGAKGNGVSVAVDLGRRALRRLRVGRLEPASRRRRRGLDVFVRDLQADATTWSAAPPAPPAPRATPTLHRVDLGDGRFVAFVPSASNLHPDDGVGTQDVFVRDLQADTTTLVSRAAGATGATGNGNSF